MVLERWIKRKKVRVDVDVIDRSSLRIVEADRWLRRSGDV